MEMDNLCIFKLGSERGCWGSMGHSLGHLTMASCVGGRGGNYLSSLYCQIIDSVRKIEAITSIVRPPGQRISRVKCDIYSGIF